MDVLGVDGTQMKAGGGGTQCHIVWFFLRQLTRVGRCRCLKVLLHFHCCVGLAQLCF